MTTNKKETSPCHHNHFVKISTSIKSVFMKAYRYFVIKRISNRKDSYVVIPQGEYDSLYNKQYLELMTLKKKIDPDDKREKYLETTLKMHYLKVYNDMIQNNYILTNSARTQEHLDTLPDGDYKKNTGQPTQT